MRLEERGVIAGRLTFALRNNAGRIIATVRAKDGAESRHMASCARNWLAECERQQEK